MIDNYLKIEGLLKEKLRDCVSDAKAVYSVSDLAAIQEKAQVTPALHVLYSGDQLPGADGNQTGTGRGQMVFQRWMVVIAVRNVRDVQGGEGVRESAGALISSVIKAVQGWNPSCEFRNFKRVSAPTPVFNAGFGYFPLAFEIQLVTVSNA